MIKVGRGCPTIAKAGTWIAVCTLAVTAVCAVSGVITVIPC
jgi:hypothetical protein